MAKEKMAFFKDYILLTISTLIIVIGVYFFKFPNNFSFGGVTGIAVLLAKFAPTTPGYITIILSGVLLLCGFLFLGRSFGIKTVYVTVFTSIIISILERFCPMSAPLTNEPVLELIFAIFLPSAGSALLFNLDAASGGTDIIAMILKKYTSIPIGIALFSVDMVIALSSFLVYDIRTGLFSTCGLLAKSLVIDSVIESVNLCKWFHVVCENPEPICEFIIHDLKRSATICKAEGAYSHRQRYIVLTVMRRGQAKLLRDFVKMTEPEAFVLITNSSEIIGKGFGH